jgi:small multidrug resistance family-3 protein
MPTPYTSGMIIMNKANLSYIAWIVFILSAALGVGGDAIIRKGLFGKSYLLITTGCLVLAGYGLFVNTLKWDFSKLLGVYVSIFALISVLFGKIFFHDTISIGTIVGIAFIVIGGLVIHNFG